MGFGRAQTFSALMAASGLSKMATMTSAPQFIHPLAKSSAPLLFRSCMTLWYSGESSAGGWSTSITCTGTPAVVRHRNVLSFTSRYVKHKLWQQCTCMGQANRYKNTQYWLPKHDTGVVHKHVVLVSGHTRTPNRLHNYCVNDNQHVSL